jgi:hypothetical protein
MINSFPLEFRGVCCCASVTTPSADEDLAVVLGGLLRLSIGILVMEGF